MISFYEAIEKILEVDIPKIGDEKLVFVNSLDRVLSEDIKAKENIPLAPLSSMDGYAFNFDDIEMLKTCGLEILQDNPAGNDFVTCKKGGAIKTFTGSLMPLNTDTMLIVEDAIIQEGRLFLKSNTSSLQRNAWVRQIGSNYKNGETLLYQGQKVSPYEIGLLAELNYNFVSVKQKPKVGILVSGNEIIEVGEIRQHQGQVRSVNNHLLKAMVEKFGGQAVLYSITEDSLESIDLIFSKMLKECDFVVTTGGMSKGDYDFTQDVIAKYSNIVFKGVNMKPGKPVLFALSKDAQKPILGLPGNPNATAVTFYLFGKMIFEKMFEQPAKLKILNAYLKDDLIRTDNRTEFRSCKIEIINHKYYVSKLDKGNQSAIINNLCDDRALVILEENGENLKQDSEVKVILFKEF